VVAHASEPVVAAGVDDPAVLTGASGGPRNRQPLEIDKIFRAVIRLGGSDLHLKVNDSPMVRVRGALRPLDMPGFPLEQMKSLVLPMLDDRTMQIFRSEGGVDFSRIVEVPSEQGAPKLWRFRINLMLQMGNLGMVAHKVERTIPNFEALNLPPIIEQLCHFDQGMVLLAGVTGCGKSTTIAAMLDYINHHEHVHILTIEDPIEFVYEEDKALINQREIGVDVKDFAN